MYAAPRDVIAVIHRKSTSSRACKICSLQLQHSEMGPRGRRGSYDIQRQIIGPKQPKHTGTVRNNPLPETSSQSSIAGALVLTSDLCSHRTLRALGNGTTRTTLRARIIDTHYIPDREPSEGQMTCCTCPAFGGAFTQSSITRALVLVTRTSVTRKYEALELGGLQEAPLEAGTCVASVL